MAELYSVGTNGSMLAKPGVEQGAYIKDQEIGTDLVDFLVDKVNWVGGGERVEI